MSNRHDHKHDKFRIVERITYDLKVPWWEGADMDDTGWRCIPMPPGDPAVEGWEILSDEKDDRTVWFRRCTDHVAEAHLGRVPDEQP
jgi:hypothetical protein